MGDLSLRWRLGKADLAIVDDDLESDEGLRTAVILSLFVYRRAADTDELPTADEDRRGWWGDEFLPAFDDRIGSRLWLLSRSKRQEDIRRLAKIYDLEALQWLIDDRVAERIEVSIEFAGIDRIYHLIEIYRPGETEAVSFRFDHVWEGEASRVERAETEIVIGAPTALFATPPPAVASSAAVTPAVTVGAISLTPPPAVASSAAVTPAADNGNPLLGDFDFSKPVVAFDFTSASATEEWTLQELSGTYANGPGSEALTNTSGLMGQEAIGLYNGTDQISRKAWEANGTSPFLQPSTSTPLNSANASICARIVYRIGEFNPASDRGLLFKKGSADTAAGWGIYFNGGSVYAIVADGTNFVEISVTPSSGSFADGAYHYAELYYDQVNDTLTLRTDRGTAGPTSTSTVTGSLSSANLLRVGNCPKGTSPINFQAAYVGGAVGTTPAANMAAENFWAHATDPSGLLETIDRDCLISVPVSPRHETHFGPDQLPIGYHSLFDFGTYGLFVNDDVTNLLTDSELLSNWANKSGTPTKTDRAADAPSGMRIATSIAATAANDQIGQNFTTAASTEYTLSVWIKRSGASNVTGRLIFYNETGTAELASQVIMATGEWQLVKVTATTAVGQISSSIRIEVDTSGETMLAWGAQANTGDGRGSYIRTGGSTASLVRSNYARDTEDLMAVATGEFNVRWVRTRFLAGSCFLIDQQGAIDDARRLFCTTAVQAQLRNGGTTEASVSLAGEGDNLDQLNYAIVQWGPASGSPEVRMVFNGTVVNEADNMPYENTATGSFEKMTIGPDGASQGPDAFIQRVRTYNAFVSPVLELADFDFSKPVVAFDFSSSYATDQWQLAGPVASSYANTAFNGSETLDVGSGGLEDQEAIGLFDGTDLISRKAFETTSTGDDLLASGTAALNSNNQDIAIRVVFRTASAPATQDYLFGRRDSSTGAGFSLFFHSTGAIRFQIHDGTNTATVDTTRTGFGDSSWHCVSAWYDVSTNTIAIRVDDETEDTASSAAVTGSLTNTDRVRINAGVGSTGAGLPGPTQYAYAGGCVNVGAQEFYGDHATLWRHAKDPTGLLQTIDRNSAIAIDASAARVAHFGPDQLPIGYHSAFDAGTFALYANSAITNLLTDSELLSNWTAKSGTPTVTDKAGNAPDGFRGATSITATAADDQLGLNFTTAASTQYTLSVWIKRNGGSDVTGRLIFYNETGTAELSAQAFTATGEWQLVKVTATTAVGQVSSSIRIEVDTNTESIFAWGAQANLGESDARGAYCRTTGSTASLVECKYNRATQDVVATAAGTEVLVTFVDALRTASGGLRYLMDGEASPIDDARRLWIDTSDRLNHQQRFAGTTEVADTITTTANPIALGTKYVAASQLGIAGGTELRGIVNGVAEDDAEVMPFEGSPTGAFEGITIGNNYTLSGGMDGWIQSIKSYDALISVGA